MGNALCPLPSNCLTGTCDNSDLSQLGACTSCQTGFMLQDGLCTSSSQNCQPPANCQTADCSSGQAICTACNAGFMLSQGQCQASMPSTPSTPVTNNGNGVVASSCDLSLIPHCLKADCWPSSTTVEIQCTSCEDGWYIDQSLVCSQCRSCDVGQWISYPCEGYTNTVCSNCTQCDWDKVMVAPCPGNGTADATQCTPQKCFLYGCGASNIGVVCNELNDTSFTCTCPNDTMAQVVIIPQAFEGCDQNGTTDEQVVASLNGTTLEAFLKNNILTITGAILVNVNGRTFTINLNTTVPADSIEEQLREQIAAFLGGGYTSDDITLQYSNKRAFSSSVGVTVNGQDSGAMRRSFDLFLFGMMYLALHL